jgi:hypothetical protein
MPTGVYPESIVDLANMTLRKLGRMRFTQAQQTLQRYHVFQHWFRKGKVKFEDNGLGIRRNIMDRTADVARHSGILDQDTITINDHLTFYNVPWVHADTHWGFAVQETFMNAGESMIVNVIEPRRINAMERLAKIIEDRAWAAPTVAQKYTLPAGIPFWVVKNSTEGFTGAYPQDFTDLFGIDLAQSTGFKNYSNTYTAVTKSNLIARMKVGHRKMQWTAVRPNKDYRTTRQNYEIFTDGDTNDSLETLAEAQNESLGDDLAPMQTDQGGDPSLRMVDHQVTFRRHPIYWIPKLDEDTQNPVYMIDQSAFKPAALKQDYLRETPPDKVPGQHNAVVVWVDLSYNFLCEDRRTQAVFYIA